ncbi:MAG: response regulator [Proteobacteria bacterium]|nr:response regulator [Pseudomonadota bacterium]
MPKILIVDDQRCVREVISEELIREGYHVESVGNAESARAHLRSSRPDLVLLDLYLDGPDGWDVLRDIKMRDPHLPVLILTAYDSFKDDPRLCRADGYVIKSADFGQLKHRIADALRQKQGPQGRVEAKKGFFPEVGVAQLL